MTTEYYDPKKNDSDNAPDEKKLSESEIQAGLKRDKRKSKQKNKIVQDIKELIMYIMLFLKSL